MKIANTEYARMKDFALEEIRNRAKDPHDNEETFVAKCWTESLRRVLLGSGWVLSMTDTKGEQCVFEIDSPFKPK